jgi:hypothetical protein
MSPILFLSAFVLSPTQARPDDVASVDSIIKAVYDCISGPKGQKRDWPRFKALFSSKGSLMAIAKRPNGDPVQAFMTPDDYASRNSAYLEKEGFFEKETKRKVFTSGDIVQVFSMYESRHLATDKKPFDSGTNALQLFSDGKRWYVHSILWKSGK